MKFLSFPTHRRHVPQQGLLLAVSLITFWIPLNAAQLTVDSVPANAIEGEDVLLLVQNLPENFHGYNWYKGENVEPNLEIARYVTATQTVTNGPAYSGRETLYTNGSLLLRNVRLNDTGFYTIQISTIDLSPVKQSGELHVYEQVAKPSIQTHNTTVMENSPVSLTCVTNDTGVTILWFFNGQSLKLTDRVKLSSDNSSLTIDPVRREDDGEYYCEVSNPANSREQSDPLKLDVIYNPDTNAGLSAGAIAGIVIGVLAGVALIAALVYFLYLRKTGGSGSF